jgi:hypothetical protein
MVGEHTIGPDSQVENLLAEYGLGANSMFEDIVENDTDRLLVALLLEQRGQDLVEALDSATQEYDDETTAKYISFDRTATDDWDSVAWDFTTESIDVRISNADALVAFADPTKSDNVEIAYATGESPIVGIPAETTEIWYKNDPSASSDASITVEAWG